MYCSKCGNQLKNENKFCEHCGEPHSVSFEQPVMPNGPQINKSDEPYQQEKAEASTGKIFMEQLGVLTKTGTKVIKEAAAQAQVKAGELSASVDKSQGLSRLGEKNKLFLLVCGALALNVLLLLSKTIYFEMRYIGDEKFSVIGFCSAMLNLIDELGKYANGATDGPFYMAVKWLEIISIIFIIAAVTKALFPIFTKVEGKPVPFKLIRIAAIFSVSLTFLFLLFCMLGLSSQSGVEFRLTFFGWLYVIESVALIALVFKLSPIVKKRKGDIS